MPRFVFMAQLRLLDDFDDDLPPSNSSQRASSLSPILAIIRENVRLTEGSKPITHDAL